MVPGGGAPGRAADAPITISKGLEAVLSGEFLGMLTGVAIR